MSQKGLPNVRLLLRLMIDPGWAPIIVGIAFLLSVRSGYGESHDYVFHTAGGAAIGYFALRTASLVPTLANRIRPHSRPTVAFVVALIVAALWEVAELVADRVLGTTMQHGGAETLRDFAFGAIGAFLMSVIARIATRPRTDMTIH